MAHYLVCLKSGSVLAGGSILACNFQYYNFLFDMTMCSQGQGSAQDSLHQHPSRAWPHATACFSQPQDAYSPPHNLSDGSSSAKQPFRLPALILSGKCYDIGPGLHL